VTWSNFGAPGTFSPSILGSFDAEGLGFRSLQIDNLAQGWVDGAIPNHGLLLEEDLGANHNYFASEVSTVIRRPMLEICYTNECGVSCGEP